VAAGLLAACGFDVATRGAGGTEAPDYHAVTLDGEPVSLAELRGEVVLLNVWATWCPPCRKEIPELQALHETYGVRGLRVVGVSGDAAGTDGMVRRFADQFGVTYDVLRDPAERATSVFAFQGIPGTVLIDRAGTIVWRHLGPVTAEDPGLLAALEAAL
jgi:cytochrome c biogenesis protein CcmG, thiol:disulfide interchange protein DsbE